MKMAFTDRLNAILPRVTGDDFLARRGLGKEIAFFIFDYPAAEELRIRQQIQLLLAHIPLHRPGIQILHVNLLDFLRKYLESKSRLARSFDIQRTQGNAGLLKALKGMLQEQTVALQFAQMYNPNAHDLILLSGVGSVYPLIRSHTLLNNLAPLVTQAPLVLFYPGVYDTQSMQLFGKIPSENYYRAFQLIP